MNHSGESTNSYQALLQIPNSNLPNTHQFLAYKSPLLTDTGIVICKIIVGAAIGRPLQQYGITEADEQCSPLQTSVKKEIYMKATGIARRVDDLGRIPSGVRPPFLFIHLSVCNILLQRLKSCLRLRILQAIFCRRHAK